MCVFVVLAALGIGLGLGLRADDIFRGDDIPNEEVSEFFKQFKGVNPTLSGFSAGGYMSCLLHTIHSGTFNGAAPIGGGPYASPYVRRDQKTLGNSKDPESNKYPIQMNIDLAMNFSNAQRIDNISNLENNRVFILHAENDYDVPVYLAYEIEQYYQNMSSTIEIKTDIGRDFGHIFPTDADEPSIILNHLYNTSNFETVKSGEPTYTRFSMKSFCPDEDCDAAGMWDSAFLAASESCRNGTKECPVHIYLHGCWSSNVILGRGPMKETFYGNIAEKHDLIVIFPQTNSDSGACWNVGWRAKYKDPILEDTETGHLTYDNPQAKIIKQLVDAVLV